MHADDRRCRLCEIVGELESFIPTVGGHGPNWVNSVLAAEADVENSIYNEIKEFIQSMAL